jgi:LacI family transcriptional regulator, galactose operon repressor
LAEHQSKARAKPGPSNSSHVGVQNVADALGISRGTVDRALNGRRGVNPETKLRVLRVAQKLGYRPNLAARYLSSSKPITIGLAIPREVAYFYDEVRDGIFEAASIFEPLGVKILHRPYKCFGQHEIEAIRDVLREEISGLVISPAYPNRLLPCIEEAARRNVPVVCVATDAPGTKRLTSISVDPLVSGALAGELMGYFLPDNAEVIVFIGMHATVDHEQKLQSFRTSFRSFCPKGKIEAVVEAHDDATEAYRKSRSVLEQHPAVKGIYVATANSMPVIRAMEELGRTHKIKVITTDLFPAMFPHLRSGTIAATIHQRAREQGAMAFQAIVRFLAEKLQPAPQISINPAIVMRSNLHLFIPNEPSASEVSVRHQNG